MSVAKTIAEQIGGKALFMIGAKNLVGNGNTLTFKVGRNAGGVTHIRITLDEGADLYNMEALRVHGTKVTVKKELEGAFAEDMHSFIADATGMVTTFPRIFVGK